MTEPPTRTELPPLELEVNDLGESLDTAAVRLERFLAAARVAARPAYRASLVFEELATNALKYGDDGGGGALPRLSCSVRLGADEIVLDFRDRGRPFDPTTAAPPPRSESLQAVTVGGLGLALVTKVASAIDYRRAAGENRTTVHLELGRD